MPENIKLSALTESTDEQMRDGALMLNSVIDSGSSTGFTSKKTTFSRFANYILNKFSGLSLAGENQTVKEAVDGIKEGKADKSGTYDEMEVGTSKQLLSESYTIDRTPYKFRKAPGTDRLSESIVGASVAWNQLANNFSNRAQTLGITITADNANGSITVSGTATATNNLWFKQSIPVVTGHKYLLRGAKTNGIKLGITGTPVVDSGNGMIIDAISQYPLVNLLAYFENAQTYNETLYPQLFDLTVMFGATVADALYAMGNDGIKLFRSWYPSTYYAYTEATMEHVSGLEAHETVGFNTFDIGASVLGESINVNTGAIRVSETAWRSDYIRCLAETDYYASGLTNTMNSCIAFYDADKNFLGRTSGAAVAYRSFTTPQGGAYYIITQYTSGTQTFTDGRETVCVNISDESMNGTYKPYEKHTYALDASLTLRGLIKYDSSKGIYADGDTYEADGAVTRKYGIRAYQSGDESDTTVLTDGTNTVYKLTTATTESAEPFDAIQITDGTEEYVSDCLVPVGHESKYYENLRSKIEGLPTDFSAIICATEATNKASRNYAVGDYLIYGNTLYKVTTAIAANATLTVGTNISATTIMAELKALQ